MAYSQSYYLKNKERINSRCREYWGKYGGIRNAKRKLLYNTIPELRLKRQQYRREYGIRNRTKILQQKKRYYQKNKGVISERRKVKYLRNHEYILQSLRNKYHNNPEYRQKLLSRQKAQAKIYLLNLKTQVFAHYTNNKFSCVNCGKTGLVFLTIDHINGGGNKHRRNQNMVGLTLYRWLIKKKFPRDFQALCWNCNYEKYYNSINYK